MQRPACQPLSARWTDGTVLLRLFGAVTARQKPRMTRRHQAGAVKQGGSSKGRQFTAEVILWAVRWYLMVSISYRDLELMLQDRGVTVDYTTLFRWIQAYAPELEKRIRPHLRTCNGSWRVDETYVKFKGRWTYLYRAVDSRGQTIDFLLSAKRDAAAAQALLPQGAWAAAHG